MRKNSILVQTLFALTLLFAVILPNPLFSCSTFKLQKGKHLLYGHNLNEGDIGVPGMIFINKRGIYKQGRTWTELTEKNPIKSSEFCWISRYGSITFNTFGRDFPDGGMNETGLYIWEMNEDADYPADDSLPRLNQMNWMQFILDNCSSLDEALDCASDFEIDGWGWHYFVGDKNGNCAALAFMDGKPVVHKGENMPVPGLFNTPYDREMEFLKYYNGFGGQYEPDLNDPEVPRFVKTAVMVRDYTPDKNPVEYGLSMLDNLMVDDVPEWSVLYDVMNQEIYFKTRINPDIKQLSINAVDFSNKSLPLILNMDIQQQGEVLSLFQEYTDEANKAFLRDEIATLIPSEFFTSGGLELDACIDNISFHSNAASKKQNQIFYGSWMNDPGDEDEIKIVFESNNAKVNGYVFNSHNSATGISIDHIQLIGNQLRFTFKTKANTLMEIQGFIRDNEMHLNLYGTERFYNDYTLYREEMN